MSRDPDAAFTLDELRAILGGLVTTLAVHPSREAEVRAALAEAGVPAGLWRVQVDPSCPVDKIYMMRPTGFDWTP